MGEFVERHYRMWTALSEAGFGPARSGPVLETGHHVGVYFAAEAGEWFARIVNFSCDHPTMVRVVWLGTDDDAVPERLRQELAKPEVMEYLRATMR